MMQTPAQQALEKIAGLLLTKTTRNEQVQYFHFGNIHYTTSQGLVLDVGAYVLAVNCPWELQQANGETIKYSEVFLRKRETGLPTVKFDWKEPGANLRDQRLKELLKEGAPLVAQKTEVLNNHGFILHFANSAQLIITPDAATSQEMDWQLFSNTGDNYSFIVGANGIVNS